MQKSEGLGALGLLALVGLLVGIGAVVTFGLAAAVYIGLILTAVLFAVIIALCRGDSSTG